MRKLVYALLGLGFLAGVCMLLPGMGHAEQMPASVTFDYTAPPPDAIAQPIEFRFYKNDETTPVCVKTDVNIRSFSCPVLFTSVDVNGSNVSASFTMSAYYNTGRITSGRSAE